MSIDVSVDRTPDGIPSEAVPSDASPPTEVASVTPPVLARPLVWCVELYQRARAGRPSPCRYTPSCSTYAIEALQAHGAVRGLWLAARRLGRCQPWGGHGYDPVPPPPDRKVN